MIEDDPELKEACSKYSAYSTPEKHQSLSNYLYRVFMKDAYLADMVIQDYREVVEAVLTSEQVSNPTEEMINPLTANQILGCIAWHFRCDHFCEGSLVSDSIANGYMLLLMKAYLAKAEVNYREDFNS